MRREIKFRAWDDINKEMVYEYCGVMTGKHISNGDILNLYENVMQFTGLHDKNGKEIYEGDILQSEILEDGKWVPIKNVVDYENGGFGFYEDDLSFTHLHSEDIKVAFEVIGNIHENKELLK